LKISNEFKVGLFAVIALVLLYFGFNYLKGIELFSKSQTYYAFYNNVDGLNVSNPVIVNGFNVGRVSDIQFLGNGSNELLVEMTINENVVIGDTAIAVLINEDFLGSKAIRLDIGNTSRRAKNGDTLRSVIDRGILAMFEESVSPVTDNLGTTITRINSILEDFTGNSQKINDVIDNIKLMTVKLNQELDANRYQLRETIANTTVLTEDLQVTVSKLNRTLDKFGTVADTVSNIQINETLAEVNTTLSDLQEVMIKFKMTDNTLGKLMNEDSLYRNLNKTVLDLDSLILHFNQYPKHFMAPLGKKHKKIERQLSRDANTND